MQIQSHQTHQFSQVPKTDHERAAFNRSCGYKTTLNAGDLVPVYLDEALPGDTFNLSLTAFARLATPIFPIMDNMFMDSFFFAVPLRLIWSNFQKFMGEQTNPGDSTSYTVPQIVSKVGGYDNDSVFDYMGLPTSGTNAVTAGKTYSHSALPLRAMNLIWNQWFRDQNMQSSVTINLGDGPDTYTDYSLLKRGKRHDYFTSALPWPQKGTAVSIALAGTAPVIPTDGVSHISYPTFQYLTGTSPDTYQYVNALAAVGPAGANYGVQTYAAETAAATGGFPAFLRWNSSGLVTDLSAVTATTINALRQAFQLQKMYEKDARGGTRYTEILRSHFGVTSPDARLQRPEYLGGGSTPVIVNPVAKTSSTDGTSPQANLAAIGTATIRNHGFTKSFTEHCIILGFVSVRADLTYQQGLERHWLRSTRNDFFWPSFAHIGEQAITNAEIYCTGDTGDATVFGYQERYAEYRYKNSLITGQLRSTYSASLDAWHLAQKFTSAPTLNSTFITETPPMTRVKALGSAVPDFIYDSYITLKCVRPMPLYGVPGQLDRF